MNDFRSYHAAFSEHQEDLVHAFPRPKGPTKKSVVDETPEDSYLKKIKLFLQQARNNRSNNQSETKRQAMNQLQAIISAVESSNKPLEKSSVERLVSVISGGVKDTIKSSEEKKRVNPFKRK